MVLVRPPPPRLRLVAVRLAMRAAVVVAGLLGCVEGNEAMCLDWR